MNSGKSFDRFLEIVLVFVEFYSIKSVMKGSIAKTPVAIIVPAEAAPFYFLCEKCCLFTIFFLFTLILEKQKFLAESSF